MEADFSGYVTKTGLKCKDGRTIMPDAFKHQDKMQVPLVWQHGHDDPESVLGHVILENRKDGVYGYGFFNKTGKATHAKAALEHKDYNAMSIWANGLVEKSKQVFHGFIKEVSLVLAGSNPGALIDNIVIRHSADGGDDEVLDDEAIITTGEELEFEHDDLDDDANNGDDNQDDNKGADIKLGYESMSQIQKDLVHHLVSEALDPSDDADVLIHQMTNGQTVDDIYNSMTADQKTVCELMVGLALQEANSNSVQQDDLDDKDDKTLNGNATSNNDKKGNVMRHNVFEADKKGADTGSSNVLSHDDLKGIVVDAQSVGSLKKAFEEYALAHGIDDIDTLFPEAKSMANAPELFGRRVEWVSVLMDKVHKTPFSRIRTLSADLTVAEARAKGYIKGNLKKEEFFRVAKRVTTPTTIYKKQKLDRDDMVDITDFDVVTWLKTEMRLMLDEELARAILVGDGRAVDDEDHINEDCIRPIATDHELYTTKVYVNIDDASSNMAEVFDAIVLHRSDLRGSGQPIMFTTEYYIARAVIMRDGMGRKLYKSLDELAAELRVSAIVPVEVLEEYDDIVAILVNPMDYNVGADQGGQVSMFDDFDIDYNQYKYLIETRCSGALVKLKSAMVVTKTAANAVLTVPAMPTFDPATGELTIVNQTGVVYTRDDTDAVINAAGSPYTVASGDSLSVTATPASSAYYFEDSNDDNWTFTAD